MLNAFCQPAKSIFHSTNSKNCIQTQFESWNYVAWKWKAINFYVYGVVRGFFIKRGIYAIIPGFNGFLNLTAVLFWEFIFA
jgi:hypothetical protein